MSKNARQFLTAVTIDVQSLSAIIFECVRIAKGRKVTIRTVHRAIAACAMQDNAIAKPWRMCSCASCQGK